MIPRRLPVVKMSQSKITTMLPTPQPALLRAVRRSFTSGAATREAISRAATSTWAPSKREGSIRLLMTAVQPPYDRALPLRTGGQKTSIAPLCASMDCCASWGEWFLKQDQGPVGHAVGRSAKHGGQSGKGMDWKTLLAHVTGSVDQELLRRKENLATENRILRNQVKGHAHLSDEERKTLAKLGRGLGKKALEHVAAIVTLDITLAWHRKLIAQKLRVSIWVVMTPC
jgi:hypothetical protein